MFDKALERVNNPFIAKILTTSQSQDRPAAFKHHQIINAGHNYFCIEVVNPWHAQLSQPSLHMSMEKDYMRTRVMSVGGWDGSLKHLKIPSKSPPPSGYLPCPGITPCGQSTCWAWFLYPRATSLGTHPGHRIGTCWIGTSDSEEWRRQTHEWICPV